ncbi:DNA adenine methylase [Streptosporangium sp. CA-135522]|uniref:DNA adenine methylase n=1 Tax=Streptosporangium sp. CA-135522 TaxID=3240072 RepID=UPI003D8C34AA
MDGGSPRRPGGGAVSRRAGRGSARWTGFRRLGSGRRRSKLLIYIVKATGRKIADQIAVMLPEHTHHVEPFAGSLAVLPAKKPSRLETVNDLDCDLMTFWKVLREQRPIELARRGRTPQGDPGRDPRRRQEHRPSPPGLRPDPRSAPPLHRTRSPPATALRGHPSSTAHPAQRRNGGR